MQRLSSESSVAAKAILFCSYLTQTQQGNFSTALALLPTPKPLGVITDFASFFESPCSINPPPWERDKRFAVFIVKFSLVKWGFAWLLLLFRYSAKGSIDQEERLAIAPPACAQKRRYMSNSLSLSVGFSDQDEANDVARAAQQGAHCHADVLY